MSNEKFDLEALIAQELARQQAEELLTHLSKGEGQLPHLLPKLDAPTAQKRYVNFAVETLISQPSLRNFLSKEDLKLFLSYLKTGSPSAGEIATKIDVISERINLLSPHLHVMDLLSIENMPKTPAHGGQQDAAQSINNTSQRTRPNKRKKQISDPESLAQAAANALFGSDLDSEPAVPTTPTQQREQEQSQSQPQPQPLTEADTAQTDLQRSSTPSRTRKPPLRAAEQTALAQQRLYELAFPERQQPQASQPVTTSSAPVAKAQPEVVKAHPKQAQGPIKAQAKAIAPTTSAPVHKAHQAHSSSVQLDGKTQSAIKVLQGKKTARPASIAALPSRTKTEPLHQASGGTQQPSPVAKPHVVRRVLSYQPPAEGFGRKKDSGSSATYSRELAQLKAQNALFGHHSNLRRKENNRSQTTDISKRSEPKTGLDAIAKNGIKVISGSKPRAKDQ